MSNTKLDLATIIARGEIEGFTGYQLWRILDAQLRAEGLEGWKRPQQVYNYDKNAMIVKGEKNVSATRKFTKNEVEEFVTKQLEKARAKSTTAVKIEEFDASSDVELEELDANMI